LDEDAMGDGATEVLVNELAPFARGVGRWRPSAGKDRDDALLGLGFGGLGAWLEARLR
jgi:hypothetical protein